MAVNLSIKGVPDTLAERLRERAERNHRSLQGELMLIIEQAAAQIEARPRSPAALRDLDLPRRGSKTIEQIAAEHRVRFPRPISTGPLAADIVRADRDAR
ncbi:MAG: Arc family DNA-binding protein [Burkholderiales bacterium]|nr:Arc family DNA-binding protein [Burkholderiales bacterium]